MSKVVHKKIRKHPGYAVGTDGSVWSRWEGRGRKAFLSDRWHCLWPSPNSRGYLHVNLNGKTVRIHRLVLEEFRGSCPHGLEARHLDGNQRNNRLENLTWGTKVENAGDKILHGTRASTKGSRNGRARLTADKVRLMRKLHRAGGVSHHDLACRFGMSRQAVGLVLSGKTWGHIPQEA